MGLRVAVGSAPYQGEELVDAGAVVVGTEVGKSKDVADT